MENTILMRKDKPAFQVIIIAGFVNLIGILLIAGSGLNWIQIVIGTILLFIGVFVLALKSEMIYDSENNRITIQWKSLFFTKGQTENLPEIDHIAIIRVKASRDLNYKSISYHDNGFLCNLNLVFKNSEQKFRKLCTVDTQEAFRLATLLSEKTNKPILDHSTPEKKWINN